MKNLGMRPDSNVIKTPKVVANGDKIEISGPISPKTADDFFNMVIQDKYKTVILNSPGGDIQAGQRIANEIKRRHLNTELSENSICMSICTGMFQAGESRKMNDKSILGYHNATVELLPDSSPLGRFANAFASKTATSFGIDQLEEWGLSPSLRSQIMNTPGTSFYCLNKKVAQRFNADNSQGVGMLDQGGGGMLDEVPATPGETVIMPGVTR